ncbi:MAG: FAD:protein FMN transferase [Magnetococcales bacterium]|nr:FAD:protein FMN transferase [Magnetococcales bacterium]
MKPGLRLLAGWGVAGIGMIALLLWWRFGGHETIEARVSTRLQMGTLVSITTWGVPDPQADQAMDRAFDEIGRIEALTSRFIPSSAVSQLNDAQRDQEQSVPEELAKVIAQGVEIGKRSGGVFDIGIGPLSDLWGFSREPPPTAPPAPEAVSRWRDTRAHTPEPAILLTPERRVRLASGAVALDLGGIAKGYAVERAMTVLRQAGVANALINAGGDMRLTGDKSGKPWHIGLRDPRNPGGVVAVMDLTGSRAVSTSGDYERFFIADGVRYHHILDPRSGAPARSGLISVTIQAMDSMTADGLSTAVFVLGETEGLKLLTYFPGSEALLIREDGHFVQTPGFVAVRTPTP